MGKKIFIVALIAAVLWFFLKGSSGSLPASIVFDSSTFKKINSQSVFGSQIAYYTSEGETATRFSRLIILSTWNAEQLSVKNFDDRYLATLKQQGGVEGEIDQAPENHCILVESGQKPQLIFNQYFTKGKRQYQISFTKADNNFAGAEVTDLCLKNSDAWNRMGEIESQVKP